MTGRIRSCSGHRRETLGDGWEMSATPVASVTAAESVWLPALVPGTVAGSLRQLGRWDHDSALRNFDAEDWCYRMRFTAPPAEAGERVLLGFDGLATLCEVFLNGTRILSSENMFLAQCCDVGALLAGDNELVLRFRALEGALQTRRPRPRWRAPMVRNQQLRWFRTTLLGRTPGWSPPAAAVGPWRAVWLERRRDVELDDVRLRTWVEGAGGGIEISARFAELGDGRLSAATLRIDRGARVHAVPLTVSASGSRLSGEMRLPAIDLWWPHTHGEPALYAVSMELDVETAGGRTGRLSYDLGHVGFRTLELERADGRFALRINGVEIFCRGACWTPLDCVSLQSDALALAQTLRAVVSAGMNMLRVAGPLVYENDEFLDLCDSLGILLWQDFMFANMDYPADDGAFLATVKSEVRQQLLRLQARPALAILCGNSEVGQQAAMFGAPRDAWVPPLFARELAAIAAEHCADVPYTPSSTHGGAFPHQASAGVASYYGVGAYLRDLSDARTAEVRFASECLAFANVPEEETLALLQPGLALRCHHPRWKERVPRDLGAGWDFDDVRDHYLQRLFGIDPLQLRYADHDRYLRLGRVATGEAMAASFSEWRRARSVCRGALVWFLRDLWPGAGWGLIDSTGLPKAAYYLVRRVLQPVVVFVTDEGTNGLAIHVVNDGAAPLRARLHLRLYRASQPVGMAASAAIAVGAASALEMAAMDLFEGFLDLSNAYRFGPPTYELLHARLVDEASGAELAETFFHPLGLPRRIDGDLGLTAGATAVGEGRYELRLQTARFAQAVHVEAPDFVADDQYFHLAPQASRVVSVRLREGRRPAPLEGVVHALNAGSPSRIKVQS
jgi:beta-mannosidase